MWACGHIACRIVLQFAYFDRTLKSHKGHKCGVQVEEWDIDKVGILCECFSGIFNS